MRLHTRRLLGSQHTILNLNIRRHQRLALHRSSNKRRLLLHRPRVFSRPITSLANLITSTLEIKTRSNRQRPTLISFRPNPTPLIPFIPKNTTSTMHQPITNRIRLRRQLTITTTSIKIRPSKIKVHTHKQTMRHRCSHIRSHQFTQSNKSLSRRRPNATRNLRISLRQINRKARPFRNRSRRLRSYSLPHAIYATYSGTTLSYKLVYPLIACSAGSPTASDNFYSSPATTNQS